MKTVKMESVEDLNASTLAPKITLLRTAAVAVLILGILSSSIEMLAFGYFMVVCYAHVLLLIWPGLLGMCLGAFGIAYTKKPANRRLVGVLLCLSVMTTATTMAGLGFHAYEVQRAQKGESIWHPCHNKPCKAQVPINNGTSLQQGRQIHSECPGNDKQLTLVNFAFSLLVDIALVGFSVIILGLTAIIIKARRKMMTRCTVVTTGNSKEDLRSQSNNGRVSLVSYGFDV